jgi:hypothetical protein
LDFSQRHTERIREAKDLFNDSIEIRNAGLEDLGQRRSAEFSFGLRIGLL